MGFVFVSGWASLDLVGTLKWRRSGQPEEQLSEPALLGEWARGAGLVDERVSTTAAELVRAVELREAMYRIFWSRLAATRVDESDVEVLNAYARRQPVALELNADGQVRRRASSRQLMASVGLDALELLGSPDMERVRECANPECTRLYVDSSRGHNRRWCGMAECGNRAKAQIFRQRHRNTDVAAEV